MKSPRGDPLERNLEKLLRAHVPPLAEEERELAKREVFARTLLELSGRRRRLPFAVRAAMWAASLAAVFVVGVAVGRFQAAAPAPEPTSAEAIKPSEHVPEEPEEIGPLAKKFKLAEDYAAQGYLKRAALEYVAAAVAFPDDEKAIRAYRNAGDLFLRANDIKLATHAYREYIERGGIASDTAEGRKLIYEGTWLLAAMASDAKIQRRVN